MEWAAVPATSARPSSVSERAGPGVGPTTSPRSPNVAGGDRVRGMASAWSQEGRQDLVDVSDEGCEGARVGRPVRSERRGHVVDVAADADGAPSVERMGEGDARGRAAGPRGRRGRWRGRRARPAGAGGRRSRRRGGSRAASARRCGSRRPGSSAASKTSTARPARARISAATSPLGPEPTTIGVGSPHRASQRQRRRFVRPRSRARGSRRTGTRSGRPRRRCARVGGGRARPRVHPAMAPRPTRVFGRRVAERALRLHLLGAEVGIVDQQVDVARQLERRLVVLADALGARARAPSGSGRGCRRWTSGRRSPGSRRCGRPCGERRSATTVKPSASKVAAGDQSEPPVAAELRGRDGEERRRHHPRQQRFRRRCRLSSAGRSNVTCASWRSPLAKKGRPWTWSQCRWVSRTVPAERTVTEELRQASQTGARIEEEGRRRDRRIAIMCQRHAGRVPAVADVLGTRCRRRPAGPAERDAHRFSLARGPRGDAPPTAPPDASGR